MKWLFQLMTLVFVFSYLPGNAQSNIQQDWRVDPLLKQVAGSRPGLRMFSRQDSKGGYINMAVLDENSAQLKWFTCHGVVLIRCS